MKTKTRWSYIWHFVPWVFSMCVGAPTELLALHTWERFNDHKIFLLFQGEKKNKSCWDFQNSLNLSSRLPSSAVFQVNVILRWPHMLWPAETPHETVEHVCFLGRGVAVLSLGSLSDQKSQPCSGVFPLSKVAGEQGWVACSDEVACELLHCHFPGSSILAPLKRADGYWPSSKWNMPLLTGP